MEIENEGKKEKKKFSFFCCFSPNCGKSNSKRKSSKNNHNTAATTGIKSNNSIQNNSKPVIKEFSLSNNKENINNDKINNSSKNSNIVINVYSNNNKSLNKKEEININNKNIHTFVKNDNNMHLSLLSGKSENKNKNKSTIDNNNNISNILDYSKISKSNIDNITNKTYKSNKNNNNISNSENSIKINIIEENKEKIINDECIKYELTSSEGINDNVNIYDNNNKSFNINNNISNNDETEKILEKKNLNITKESYKLNHNFKNNYYPTDFNLNLSLDIKKNNQVNSVLNINPKLNLSNINLNNNITTDEIQNKDETIVLRSEEINEINKIEINSIKIKTKYKLNISKSLALLKNKNNILFNSFISNSNINHRSGIFFISENNLNNSDDNIFNQKIKFGFKYEKLKIKIKKNILEEPLNTINKEKTITFNEKIKINKSQNNNYQMNNNILNTSTDHQKENEKKIIINPIISKSQKDLDQIKLNYINDNYFEMKNNNTNSNIINNALNKELNKEKENIDNNINSNNLNTKEEQENDEEKQKVNDNLTKKEELSKNILDMEGDIEDADIEEEGSKKINDTKSIMSNYIVNPLMGMKSYQKPDFNFNFRDSKENFSNFNNEVMSNKGSFFPPNASNYNETEIEIMNENGKEFSSFIETPRASGVYNKRLNFNMNNTYNLKNMNLKMKKIKDKINQNAKEIQRVNEKINKLDEQYKEYENCNKQYDIWIEKEEEESEMLINMLNFLNSNGK